MSGGVALNVSSRMSSTFFEKNLANSSAARAVEILLLELALVSPERFSHSFLEFPRPSAILPRQYYPSFPLNCLCMDAEHQSRFLCRCHSWIFRTFPGAIWRHSARQSLSNHCDVRLFRIVIVRFGQRLSRSMVSVVLYTSTSSSNSIPSSITDGIAMVEWRRSSLKVHSSNCFHDRTVLIMCSSGFLAIGMFNLTSAWSEMNSPTTTSDTCSSSRVTMRSSMWPAVCVDPYTCWVHFDDRSNLSSILTFESLVSTTCMSKSPQRTMGHRWVASTSRIAVRS